jgi:maltokinase
MYPALAALVVAFVRQGARTADDEAVPVDLRLEQVSVLSADVVRAGRPGLISVIAEVTDRVLHIVFGLRSPEDEVHALGDAGDGPLGSFEDEHGLAAVFDALSDHELALVLIESVAGDQGRLERVRRLPAVPGSVSLTYDDRLAFTVFEQLAGPEVPHPGVELFLGLDSVGFNHVPAPRAVWRRGRRDLGIVQEYQAGSTTGWVVALTSLRDLYASGGAPEHAGGDFATEAAQLGTMTARMHIGLDRAFGHMDVDMSSWVASLEAAAARSEADPQTGQEMSRLLAVLGRSTGRSPAIRTHGDFHLGRVARTDLGWFVLDFSPGGMSPFSAGLQADGDVAFGSTLTDVADMLWSLHRVAEVAAIERDPSNSFGLTELAQAWKTRNRQAFLDGYLHTAGMEDLLPADEEVTRAMVAAFEVVRSASSPSVVPNRP